MREGIGLIIGSQPDMEVVGSVSTGEEALTQFERYRPDITLMDLRLPGMSGVDAIRGIVRRDALAKVVVLTMYEGDEDIYQALEAGAVTYLLKDMLADDLIRIIRDVNAGERPLTSDIRSRLASRSSHPGLTFRETEVLELISCGERNKEIAARLGISEETVRAHVKNLFAKLGVNDRTGAVNVGLGRGIIHIP